MPEQTVTTESAWLVATIARYVLVNARDEAEASRLGRPALYELYADMRERLGREHPIVIHTVRRATEGEVEQWNWHYEMVAHGIEDLAAVMQPGLRALLSLTAQGQDTTAAALTLWREFHTARTAILDLIDAG